MRSPLWLVYYPGNRPYLGTVVKWPCERSVTLN